MATATLPRRRDWLAAAAGLALGGCASPPRGGGAAAQEIAPFSTAPGRGRLPPGWQEQRGRGDLPPTRYRIDDSGGRRALHALADASSSGLRFDLDADPRARPWLAWQWRVDRVDAAATVAVDEIDDAPARVIVAFDGDERELTLRDRLFSDLVDLLTGSPLPFATLAYVWDGRAAPESVWVYPRSSRVRSLVVESGDGRAGRWLDVRRHLVDDYRRVFGGEPGRVRSVGVLTDSDDTRGRSEAWYGDLQLLADGEPG